MKKNFILFKRAQLVSITLFVAVIFLVKFFDDFNELGKLTSLFVFVAGALLQSVMITSFTLMYNKGALYTLDELEEQLKETQKEWDRANRFSKILGVHEAIKLHELQQPVYIHEDGKEYHFLRFLKGRAGEISVDWINGVLYMNKDGEKYWTSLKRWDSKFTKKEENNGN
jgi:hypothetical protein